MPSYVHQFACLVEEFSLSHTWHFCLSSLWFYCLSSQQLQVQRPLYARPRGLWPRAGTSRPLRALRARICQYQLATRINGKLLMDLELVQCVKPKT